MSPPNYQWLTWRKPLSRNFLNLTPPKTAKLKTIEHFNPRSQVLMVLWCFMSFCTHLFLLQLVSKTLYTARINADKTACRWVWSSAACSARPSLRWVEKRKHYSPHYPKDPCMVDIYLQYPTIYQYLHIFTIKLNHSCRIHVPVPWIRGLRIDLFSSFKTRQLLEFIS